MTAPELSARERETLARIESTPAAPESFDATAAVRRVMELHQTVSEGSWRWCQHCRLQDDVSCPTVHTITGTAS